MARASTAYISQKRLGSLIHVRLSGTIDETFGSIDSNLEQSTVWLLDLAHVERVTSWGVRHWIELMKEANRIARAVLIARAPPCVVDQLNTIEGFQNGATVLSVMAPYLCHACNQRTHRPIVLAEHAATIAAGSAPEQECPTCAAPLEFEDFAPHFFAFTAYQPAVTLTADVKLFNEWLCGPESTGDVEARFLAHTAGASIYALQPHPKPARPSRPQPVAPPPPPATVRATAVEKAPVVLAAHLGRLGTGVATMRAPVMNTGYRQVSREEDANVLFSTAPLEDPSGRPVIQLFDGVLSQLHSPTFDATGPALLLACRQTDQTPSDWELKLLNRLLRRVELLPPGAVEKVYDVASMDDVRLVSEAAGALATTKGASASTRDAATDVAYELMTNALLDAPVDARGEPKYAFNRDSVADVDPADACRCALAIHGDLLFIRVVDDFGRLQKSHLSLALARLDKKTGIKLDTRGGGAGLGLRRILSGSDALVVWVTPNRRTEVCAVLRLAELARRRDGLPKSLFVDAPR